jgi:tetratricopeptide (TPR) repeat protein
MTRRITVVTLVCSISIALGCEQVDATRDFHHGVKFYEAKSYAASIEFFEQAAGGLDDPAISYNLALAYLALLKSRDPEAGGELLPTASVPALEAVRAAIQNPEMDVERLVELHYIESRMHQVAGDSASARAALQRSLALDPVYRPSLRELVKLAEREAMPTLRERVKLEEKRPSPLVRLVVALAAGGEPQLVEVLAR